MIDFRLAQLEYFCEVCRTGSVTRAAENMHITQPSVSAAIRGLETAYAVTLFHREKNRLVMTQEGAVLYEAAAKLISHADALDTQMRNMGSRAPVIRIGVSPMISVFLFLPIFKRFHGLHPEITLEMHEFGSIDSRERVRNNELDMAIVIGDSRVETDFNWMPLMETSLLYCVSRPHRYAGRDCVRIEDLEDERLIMMRATSYQTGALVNKRFEEAGIKPAVLLYSNQLTLIRQYIRTYDAGAFLMKDYLDECLKDDPDMVGVPLDPPIDIPIGLIQNRGVRPTQHASIFLTFLSEMKKSQIKPISDHVT